MAEKHRGILSIMDLVKVAAREEAYGLSLPKQLGESFGGALKFCKTGRSVDARKKGFDKSLWEFLEAKPSWLKTDRSWFHSKIL